MEYKTIGDLPRELRLAINATTVQTRYDVGLNSEWTGNILSVDYLVFQRLGTLKIGRPNDPFVAIVAREIHFQDGTATSIVTIPTVVPTDGAAGANGANGAALNLNGQPGGNGSHGSDAPPQPLFVILCAKVSYGIAPESGGPSLVVQNLGADGGSGGNGGHGGNGANGHKGYRGMSHADGELVH